MKKDITGTGRAGECSAGNDAIDGRRASQSIRSEQSGRRPNWRAGEKITPDNVDTLKPGTAVSTFKKDPKSNGELRYLSRPSGNHAGIVDSVGEKNGRQGVFVLDQYRGRTNPDGKQEGNAEIRFYPLERRPGDGRYLATDFYAIQRTTPNAK